MFLFSFPFEKKISFRALIIEVNRTSRYRNGYHHQRHHHCYGYSKRKKKTKKDDKYIIGYTHKNDEHVAPCWKTGSKNLTGKTAAFLCNVLLFVVLWYEEERSWCLTKGNCVEKTICWLNECSQVKFKNPINCGCSYTTASSRLNCTPRRSHDRTVSSGSENCSHSVRLRFQCYM